MKSEPVTETNGTPASPATARAMSVLPVPGRADEQHALRDPGPDLLELLRVLQEVDDLGDLVFDRSVAGDVAERRFRFLGEYTFARLRPMFMTAPIWPWARRLIQMKSPTISNR